MGPKTETQPLYVGEPTWGLLPLGRACGGEFRWKVKCGDLGGFPDSELTAGRLSPKKAG